MKKKNKVFTTISNANLHQAYLWLIWGLFPAYLAVNSDKAPRRKPTGWVQIPRG